MKWLVLGCPQHPHNRNSCGKRSISAQETAMKKTFFFQKYENRYIFHIFRDLKIRIFMILPMFLSIIKGIPIENGPRFSKIANLQVSRRVSLAPANTLAPGDRPTDVPSSLIWSNANFLSEQKLAIAFYFCAGESFFRKYWPIFEILH